MSVEGESPQDRDSERKGFGEGLTPEQREQLLEEGRHNFVRRGELGPKGIPLDPSEIKALEEDAEHRKRLLRELTGEEDPEIES